MNDNPFNNRRPTEIEDQAHVEAVRHFAEPLKQFPTSRDAVKHLERDVAKTALAVLAASQRPPQGNPLLTTDGSQWHESIHLFDNIFVCHRPLANGTEYARLWSISHRMTGMKSATEDGMPWKSSKHSPTICGKRYRFGRRT